MNTLRIGAGTGAEVDLIQQNKDGFFGFYLTYGSGLNKADLP